MNPNKYVIFTIFLTVFLDMLGVGLVIPVIAPLLLESKYLLLSADTSLKVRHIVLGILLATFPLAQLFGAPMLGVWADRIGRKRVLLLSLVGTLIGNLLFGYGVVQLWLWLLFASQVLDGFTGGNISIAMSAIADVSRPEDKPRNFGLIGMAFGLGFIIGPFVGGQLAAHFDGAMPFWVCSGLNVLNLVFAQLYFPETYKPTGVHKKISLWAGIENLLKISPRFTIAAAFGNVHGVYKPGNVKLQPVILKNSQDYVQQHAIPVVEGLVEVLHVGLAVLLRVESIDGELHASLSGHGRASRVTFTLIHPYASNRSRTAQAATANSATAISDRTVMRAASGAT